MRAAPSRRSLDQAHQAHAHRGAAGASRGKGIFEPRRVLRCDLQPGSEEARLSRPIAVAEEGKELLEVAAGEADLRRVSEPRQTVELPGGQGREGKESGSGDAVPR